VETVSESYGSGNAVLRDMFIRLFCIYPLMRVMWGSEVR
jgi:hypothetical protein